MVLLLSSKKKYCLLWKSAFEIWIRECKGSNSYSWMQGKELEIEKINRLNFIKLLFLIFNCRNYLCIRCTIFLDLSVQKLEVHIIHGNWILNFYLASYVAIFWIARPKVSYTYLSCKLRYNKYSGFIQLQRNSYWNACLFITCFLYCGFIFADSLLYFRWSCPNLGSEYFVNCFESLFKFLFLVITNRRKVELILDYSNKKFQKVNMYYTLESFLGGGGRISKPKPTI